MGSLTATRLMRFGDALLRKGVTLCLPPGERGDVRNADAILHSNPIRRSAAMTHGDSGRHTAHALRRCATTPEESLSAPGERGDVRSADAILHSSPIRRSAAMTHEVTDRHPAHALRRCATTPEDSLSAPGERGDVRSADTLSVNPGLRPGQSNQRSMHRNAVPLRHNLVFG